MTLSRFVKYQKIEIPICVPEKVDKPILCRPDVIYLSV